MTSLTGNRGPTGRLQLGNATGGNIIPKGYNLGQLQQFTPEQMQLFGRLFGQVSPDSYLSRLAGGDESLFEDIEAPHLRQFNELQGNLASRFSGMGGLGARRSSGFQNSLTAAGSSLVQDLKSQRQSLQRQAIMDLMGISESLLGQRPQEKFLAEQPQKQNSFLQNLLLGLSGGVSQGLGSIGSSYGLKLLGL